MGASEREGGECPTGKERNKETKQVVGISYQVLLFFPSFHASPEALGKQERQNNKSFKSAALGEQANIACCLTAGGHVLGLASSLCELALKRPCKSHVRTV